MLTAIVVGGIGIFFLHADGLAAYHIKPANMLAVAVGAVLFGVGMALYGYCPGTGLAAIGTGSVHALAGAAGMIAGAITFALSFDWVKATLLPSAALGACPISLEFPTLPGWQRLPPPDLPRCTHWSATGALEERPLPGAHDLIH